MKDPPRPSHTVFSADLADPRARAAAVRGAVRGAPTRGAVQTSDLSRVKRLGVAAVFAAAGVAGALVAGRSGAAEETGGPGPLSAPHRAAKLQCNACHGDLAVSDSKFVASAKGACVNCHAAHGSTRAGHQRLLGSGELRCTSCHAPHGPHQGASFTRSGAAARYGDGAEIPVDVAFRAERDIVVPLIPASLCGRCHALENPRDPIARCLRAGTTKDRLALCLDEHQDALPTDATDVTGSKRSPTPLSRGSVCERQHFPDRPLAWEAARVAASQIPWVSGRDGTGSIAPLVLGGLSTSVLGYAGVALVERLRRRRKAGVAALAPERKRLPVIRTSTCLGCYACVDACPYGVLEVERYVAVVARPEACCGLVLCEQRCPNGSLQMADGDVDEDRPRLSESLESLDQPGLFLAGDITGVPLIKNAIVQGHHAADAALDALARRARPADAEDVFDLCIVGAGPSGISAALRAKERGATFVVIEQGHVAESIRSFPRGKLVFDQPLDLPLAGKLWLRESTKEELLMHWMRIVRREALPIREGRRMTRLERRSDGSFDVRAAKEGRDDLIRARTVILAVGQRGTPRRLGCEVPEAAESRVYYHLADAKSLEGQRVLVVGLGDTAMEAAIALAHQIGSRGAGGAVLVAHRGPTYTRGQRRNIEEIERLRKAGRVDVRFGATVTRVSPTEGALEITLGDDAGSPGTVVHVDAVLVLIGNLGPAALLSSAGVKRVGETRSH